MTAKKKKSITNSPQETEKLGESIAKQISAGATILLFGELGSGKTTLTRGICRALGISTVKSPSFVIVNIYHGDNTYVYHIDLYRISSIDSETGGEIAEYLYEPDAIKIVEWAENLPEKLLPSKRINVYINRISDAKREITLENNNS